MSKIIKNHYELMETIDSLREAYRSGKCDRDRLIAACEKQIELNRKTANKTNSVLILMKCAPCNNVRYI